jgi:DNA-binding transcriptional LysR family regulator
MDKHGRILRQGASWMINITFQQVDAFLMVAERLNIVHAAGSIFSSPSALSKTITRLENTLGVKLFERGNRGVTLTQEGQYLYNKLKKPFDVVVNSLGEVQEMQRLPKQRLRIGCPDTYNYNPVYNVVKTAIDQFTEQYPNIEVTEIIYEFEPLQTEAVFLEVDLIVAPSFITRYLKDASTMKLARLDSYISIAASHPLAQSDELDFTKLADDTFYEVSVGNFDAIEKSVYRICGNLGFTPKAVRSVPNILSLIRTIGTGRGVSISGQIDSAAFDVSIRYYPLPKYTGFADSYVMAAWLPDSMTAEVRSFLPILRLSSQNFPQQ